MSDYFDEPAGPNVPAVPMAAEPSSLSDRLSEATAEAGAGPGPEIVPDAEAAPPEEATPVTSPETEEARQEPAADPAVTRFKACRWHETQENAPSYCANRDVLPFAGKNGFNPEAWCLDCKLYKVKRTVKKRSSNDWDDY